MKKNLLIVTVCMLLLVCTVSGFLGTFKRGENVQLITAVNESTLNITVYYPNSTKAVDNSPMTKNGYRFNYTFTNTDDLGMYIYDYCNDVGTCYVNDFEITGSGFELNEPRSIMYVGMMALLFILFLVNIAAIPMLPKKNNQDDDGFFFSINNLKYVRAVLWVTGYGLLLGLIFIGANLSKAYLGTDMFGNLLFDIYSIMMTLLYPMVLIWIIWIFVMVFKDKEMKNMIERGVPVEGKP